MQPIRGGPKSRGPFKGPVLNNLGTGETPGGVLYVNRPSKGWAAPDILPNIALLALVVAVYVPPAPIDPPIAKRPIPQIDLAPNIAVNQQTITPAGTYIEPQLYKRLPPQVEVFPDIAVNFQTARPAGTYLEPTSYPRSKVQPDSYLNIAVEFQTITPAGSYIDPLVRRSLFAPDLYPNIAALQVVVGYQPPAPIEPWIAKRYAPQIDPLSNIAALTTLEPALVPRANEQTFPPVRRSLAVELYPNIAVTILPPSVRIPAPIEPTLTLRAWGTPDLYPNIAVRFQTIQLAGRYLDPPHTLAVPWQTDVLPNIAIRFQALPFIPVAPIEPWIGKRLPPQIDYLPNVAALAPPPPVFIPVGLIEPWVSKTRSLAPQIDYLPNIAVFAPAPVPIVQGIMPNVIGQIIECARDTLKRAGVYNPSILPYFNVPDPVSVTWYKGPQPPQVQYGLVTAQSIPAGTPVQVNTPIVLQASIYVVSVSELPETPVFPK